MQIAETLIQKGMSCGEKFHDKLTDFVREHNFKKIIETGTYLGQGTTRAILNGLTGSFQFISIEADPEHFRVAKRNLRNIPGLHLINGLSVGKSDLPVSLSADFPEFVAVDHQPVNRLQLYLKEVSHPVKDHALNMALAAFNFKPEFVLLDSAGYMGFVEFQYLISRVQGAFYLALDDTDHVKHYDTMRVIEKDPRFEIIWQVRGVSYPGEDEKDKFGSAIIKFTP